MDYQTTVHLSQWHNLPSPWTISPMMDSLPPSFLYSQQQRWRTQGGGGGGGGLTGLRGGPLLSKFNLPCRTETFRKPNSPPSVIITATSTIISCSLWLNPTSDTNPFMQVRGKEIERGGAGQVHIFHRYSAAASAKTTSGFSTVQRDFQPFRGIFNRSEGFSTVQRDFQPFRGIFNRSEGFSTVQ